MSTAFNLTAKYGTRLQTVKITIQLTVGHDLLAPEVLPFEIGNALTAMMKKRSLEGDELTSAWDMVQAIPVELRRIDIRSALEIASRFNIKNGVKA